MARTSILVKWAVVLRVHTKCSHRSWNGGQPKARVCRTVFKVFDSVLDT